MLRQRLRVNQSGIGDCQVELRDAGGVSIFARGGVVVDVRNNDIEIAKAIYELILARTNERLKDCVDKSGLYRKGVKAKSGVRGARSGRARIRPQTAQGRGGLATSYARNGIISA